MTEVAPLLEVRGIGKRFPGVRALHEIDLVLGHGEVLAVVGENGAGKSTLMKILAGVQPADEGEVRFDGEVVSIDSPRMALDLGIALIHQELNLARNLSVGANVFLGREPLRSGLIDERRIQVESRRFLELVGLDIDPAALLGELTIGRQQMVEIAKALSVDARVLIMDEPTSSLSHSETESLFRVIRDLQKRGVSIIYISHRLGEVCELADRVVVLRDGANAGDLSQGEISHDAMVRLMVGRELSAPSALEGGDVGEVVLDVRGLRTAAYPNEALDLSLRKGEIVGMAGLVGAGRTEVLETLFGVTPAVEGSIGVAGREVQVTSPRLAIRAGLALAPEDRKTQGLVLDLTVRENLSLAVIRRDCWFAGFLDPVKERGISRQMIERMQVKTPSDRQMVRYLSGGNQQKVVLGKWLSLAPQVLLLDEPTRGIDVGAKREVYNVMKKLAADGVAILFVSSELEEIINLSDRALVMHEGRITGELIREELNEEALMQLATEQSEPTVA